MSLSEELVSQLVKAASSTEKKQTESTVYGVIVKQGDAVYVRVDGSDGLTPVSTTADVSDGERVTVLIKDHMATITGNVSSPSAKNSSVQDLSSSFVEFKRVNAEHLSATNAEIENLWAKNAEIAGNITAHSANIEELKAKDVEITGTLEANAAEIKDIKATTITAESADLKFATIENLEVVRQDVFDLNATYGDFEELATKNFEAVNADIKNLTAKDAEITGTLTANSAEIETLKANSLTADQADLKYATIENLKATNVNVEKLEANKATVNQLTAAEGRIKDLETNSLTATSAVIKELQADVAEIENLKADVADIDTLIFGSASGDTIQASFANAVIAQLGNAQIKSAMIESVSASKLDAGSVNTNKVSVGSEDGKLVISDETIQISDATRVRVQIGKDADDDYSINIWDADGKLMFSEGGITDSAIKEAIIRNDMVSDNANISASKLDISSLFTEINGSTETIKATKIYLDDEKQTLDVAFTNMSSDLEDLSGNVSSQGTALSVVQGQISSKVWNQDISNAVDPVKGDINTLNTNYSTLNQTVSGISATVASHTTQIANKADGSAVTAVNDRVTSVAASLDGFKSTVSETYATTEDLTEVSDAADAIATRMSTAEAKINQKADSIELQTAKSEILDTLEDDYYTKTETDSAIKVSGDAIELRVSNSYATKQELNSLEIGGRNLAVGTFDEWTDVSVSSWSAQLPHTANDLYRFDHHYSDYGVSVGDWMTFAVDLSATGKTLAIRIDCYSEDGTKSSGAKFGNFIQVGETGRSILTLQVSEEYPMFKVYIGSTGTVADTTTERYKCLKVERGTKATDWTPAPEDVEQSIDNVHEQMREQNTSIVNTCSEIILSAMDSYVETSNYDEFKNTIESQLRVMAEAITMNFTTTTNEIKMVDGRLDTKFIELEKYIEFSDSGIAISAGEGSTTLRLDNDIISFEQGGTTFGWWDPNNFKTGNILVDVNERAQFGNFAFIPRSDGSLSFLKVAHNTGMYVRLVNNTMFVYGAYPTLDGTTLVINDMTGERDGTTLILKGEE